MDTGTRANVDDEVSVPHGLFVMLNNDKGISKIPHLFHRLDEFGVVSLMKTN